MSEQDCRRGNHDWSTWIFNPLSRLFKRSCKFCDTPQYSSEVPDGGN